VRDDDRALFLEALLSARDRLVVLYTGRDPVDDRPRPPAVPVAELLDVLDATFQASDGRPAREHLTTHHPLQPFAFRAFDGTSPAHDRRMHRAALARRGPARSPAPFLTRELPAFDWPQALPLSELDRFYAAPIRTLVRRSLGAWQPQDEATVEDREPMDLAGGLELWAVRDALLRLALQGTDLSEGGEAWRWALRCGALPMGMPGEVALRAVLLDVDAIVQSARPHLAEPVRRLDLTLPLSRTSLVDQPSLRGERAVVVTASKVRGKKRFSAWLGHLLLCACGHAVESHVWGNDSHVAFGPVAADEAAGLLERLAQLYGWGLRLPLMWFPEASWTWFRAQRWAKDPEDGLRRGFQSVGRSWGNTASQTPRPVGFSGRAARSIQRWTCRTSAFRGTARRGSSPTSCAGLSPGTPSRRPDERGRRRHHPARGQRGHGQDLPHRPHLPSARGR